MKLDLEIKNTLDKINRDKSPQDDYDTINQKYKQLYMNGDVVDPFAGMGVDGKIYDKDMLRKEFLKRKILYIPLIAIAVFLTIFLANITINNIYMRLYGEVITASYVEQSRLCKRTIKGNEKKDGYVFVWKYTGEAINESEVSFSWSLPSGITYSGRFITDRNRFKGGKNEFREMIDNCNPIELALIIYPENLKFYQDFNKNEEIKLYYLPDSGEDYLDLRILEKIWVLVVADILIILFDAFLVWRIVESIKEERRINKSYE